MITLNFIKHNMEQRARVEFSRIESLNISLSTIIIDGEKQCLHKLKLLQAKY